MNVEKSVENSTAELIELVKRLIESGSEQLPEVISQLLLWKTLTASITTVILLCLLSVFVCLALSSFRLLEQYRKEYDEGETWTRVEISKSFASSEYINKTSDAKVELFHMTVPAVVLSVFLTMNLYQLLKIIVAPKVYLLEYAMTLAK